MPLSDYNVTTPSEVEVSINTAASVSLAAAVESEKFVGEQLSEAPLSEDRAFLVHGHLSLAVIMSL